MTTTRGQKKREGQGKRLEEAINSLFSRENLQGVHSKSSIKPTRNMVSEQESYLDALARLVTNKTTDVCVATCCFNKKLFLASNRGKMDYARSYLSLLREFSINPNLQNYARLAKEAIKNIYLLVEANSSSDRRKISLVEQNFRSWIENNREKEIGERELKELRNLAQEFHQEIRGTDNEPLAYKKWNYLIPWQDLNIVVNVIQASWTTINSLSKAASNAIKQGEEIGSIIFIPETNCRVCRGCERRTGCRKNPHAEMKLINRLYNMQKSNRQYIGITKLACCPCEVAFLVLNEKTFSNSLHHGGTHGGTYPGWTMPDGFSSDEKEAIIERLEQLAAQGQMFGKGRESTSQIPEQLAIMPIFNLLEDPQEQSSTQAQIQISPK